jgi:hypothetical protein
VQPPLLQAFCSHSTLREVALHPPSLAGLFVYSSYGKCPFPTFQWHFPHTPTVTSFPVLRLLGGGVIPVFSGRFVYLQFCEGLPLLPFSAQGALPSLLCVFFCLLFGLFFLSFFPGWGSVCPGSMLIRPRVVCGSSVCRLAHLVVCCSRASRSWHLVVWEPSWFLLLMWSGDVMLGLGCGGVGVLLLLGGFSCKVYVQHLSKILL